MGLNGYVRNLGSKELKARLSTELEERYPRLDISVAGNPHSSEIRISIFPKEETEVLAERIVHPREFPKSLVADATYWGVLDLTRGMVMDMGDRMGWGDGE